MSNKATVYPEALSAAENELIRTRRATLHTSPPEAHRVGVALSGGGIRSATFCLGVFQALARARLLGYVDILSTVSGGGYFGGFFTGLFARAMRRSRRAKPRRF
jgi:predicted acylesterase/phospholipase RssA